ncbi:MAG: hypothetical protein Q9211_005074 [Gyalolechia sp. 1 TL-2023]
MEISIQHATNPQSQSPLYSRIPPEVRIQIFKFAVTAYEDPTRKYNPSAYYYRPGYTCAHKISTELLRTCRRIYWETFKLPASINEYTSWYYRSPAIKRNHLAVDGRLGSIFLRRHLRTVHVFAQQVWLEGAGFAGFTGLWEYACPTTLIITLRHSDWWLWESRDPLTFDPKQEGRAPTDDHSRLSDSFAQYSWGNQFRKIKGLKTLHIELETLEETKKQELDAIVDRADRWLFPLGDGRVLRLNETRTRRDRWVGVRLDEDNEDGVDEEHVIRNIPRIPALYSDDSDVEGSPLASPGVDAEDLAPAPDQASPTNSHPPADHTDMSNPSSSQFGELTIPLRIETTDRAKLEAEGVVFNDAGLVIGLPLARTSKYYVVTLTWEAQKQ